MQSTMVAATISPPQRPLPILLLLSIPLLKFTPFVDAVRIDLCGDPFLWNFYTTSSQQMNITGKAERVPGDIFADLEANGHIQNPLFGQHDKLYQWVGLEDWSYERSIQLPDNVHKASSVILHLHGLDGPASIWLNGKYVTVVDNQFVSHSLDVKPMLLFGLNILRVSFQSPVLTAKQRSDNFKLLNQHALPPECPPPEYNGACHVNFLRKMQASFSWDWAPSMPSVGIWRPIELEYFDQLSSIQQFSPVVQPTHGQDFLVNTSLALLCSPTFVPNNTTISFPSAVQRIVLIQLSLPELSLSTNFQFNISMSDCPKLKLQNLTLLVPRAKVQLWWPRGYGEQSLYQIEVTISVKSNQNGGGGKRVFVDRAVKKIAFRTIKLNQDLVLNSTFQPTGRLFQFEINNVPIFLKGTNWVPISAFPARNHTTRRLFLFHSMVEANMNALRVWGGGVYEEEEFYDSADNFGLLIWQDLMFACALYPTDAAFLRSVRAEVEEQVLRIRHHPSLLCWAGNNENELAIRSQWYPASNYPEWKQANDYLLLYRQTIQPLVLSLDPTRPFLLSSPSDGVETEREGGIARHPADPAFGDVHFYNDLADLWLPENFPIPRCSSEFGTQSVPLWGTMQRWIPSQEWGYLSEAMVSRQHHPDGLLTLPWMVFQHFPFPLHSVKNGTMMDLLLVANHNNNKSLPFSVRQHMQLQHAISSSSLSSSSYSSFFMDNFAFLTQAHQAIALQAQIEHYRRWRSRLDGHGLGRTMCAMYWQLNDVWAAPSWSSIDFDLRWKLAHHFVRRSFASLIVSMFMDRMQQFHLFVVSDLTVPMPNVTLQVQMFVLQLGFRPIFSEHLTLDIIPPQNAFEVQLPKSIQKRIQKRKMMHLSHSTRISHRQLREQGKSRENDVNNFLLSASLFDRRNNKQEQPLSPEAIMLPDQLNNVGHYGQAKIVHFAKRCAANATNKKDEFELRILATNILPLVWLDLSNQFKMAHSEVLYHFNENAFTQTEPFANVLLKVFSNPNAVQIKRSDIEIFVF